jgi:DNA-binding transcriptional ArsR family regulator
MVAAGAPAVTDVFGALAHPVRRQLLTALAFGEKGVAELAGPLPVTRPAVSQHLAVLRSVGLVTERRAGRQRCYRLQPEPLDDVRSWLTVLDSFWADGLARLASHLDQDLA